MTGEILRYLETVEGERAAREVDPDFGRRVSAIKRYQQRRFERTYSDLLASSRYRAAALFFLEELYGPMDFRERDQQFARIVPKIASLFPAEISETVRDLAQLHATSEQLDSLMGRALRSAQVGPDEYHQTWRLVAQPQARELQLRLAIEIGQALDRFTHHTWITNALKLMRGPARAAGLSALQAFLESGMTSFRAMHGAADFLQTVREREDRLMSALFADDPAILAELPAP